MKTTAVFFSPFINVKSRLFLLSFLMLFVELVLIRWVGASVIYLSYFSNFILLGSFLGIGIGFLHAKSSTPLFYLSPILLALFVFFVYLFPVTINRSSEEIIFFGSFLNDQALPLWFYLPIIFSLVTAIMACIADGVARTFQQFSPLKAYRLDILGSIAGVIAFSACSFFMASPLSWSIIIAIVFVSLLIQEWRLKDVITILQILCLLLLIIIFGRESKSEGYIWSPYYKIALYKYADKEKFLVTVNGVPQQTISSVELRKKENPFYFLPYQHYAKPNVLNDVLIIGAGTGGDVAIALNEGAKRVDAVEIDPNLYRLGKFYNPNQPYADSRVHIHINDGRAFLQKTNRLYDMIIFALPDSVTVVSGQSSLRLENYLFTIEALLAMKDHLKPEGIFAMYNYYREQWLVDRLANMLTLVFNHTPCLDTYGAQEHWLSVLTNAPTKSLLQCKAWWQPTNNKYLIPSSDNHPFIYLKENRIPLLYIVSLSLIFLISVFAIKTMDVSYHAMRNYLDLFLMGAAFLLLETKNIVNFALLFGTTWFVNALVFTGILFIIYLSIEVTTHYKFNRPVLLYIGLLFTLLIAWLIPNHLLLSLALPSRFLAATVLAFAPIFIANLIFTHRFQATAHSTDAFGANLVGAMVGGLLEYTSLIIGYQSLLIIVAVLYTLAILFKNSLHYDVGS